jgi:hypothetical protein
VIRQYQSNNYTEQIIKAVQVIAGNRQKKVISSLATSDLIRHSDDMAFGIWHMPIAKLRDTFPEGQRDKAMGGGLVSA